MRVAIVHETLPLIGGAEKVLFALSELFPDAPVFTLLYNADAFRGSPLGAREVHTSFIQRLPLALKQHRSFLPLYPLAIESLDLSSYDLVISSSYAAAHGVLTGPDQVHISYTYTPMRQAWQGNADFLSHSNFRSRPGSWLARFVLHYFRLWDSAAAQRVNYMLASSDWIARCIWSAYRRESYVIYPPVDINRFQPGATRGDYYLTVSRLEPHKHLDILLDAFSRLGYPLMIIGEGSQHKLLERKLPPNVRLLGWVTDDELSQYLGSARAFVHAAAEDFGIAMVEAQAAGCPVIAYEQGGAVETVIDGQTGRLYPEQSAECLAEAVEEYEIALSAGKRLFLDAQGIRQNALRFSKARFQEEIASFVNSVLQPEWRGWQVDSYIAHGSTKAPSERRTG